MLQHVLCLQVSNSIVERISYWLGQELMDLWYWREKTDVVKARFSTILKKVVEVTTIIKVGLSLYRLGERTIAVELDKRSGYVRP